MRKIRKEFKEGVRNIQVSQEAFETTRKEDSKRKGMLESEVIKDTKINLKTKRAKMKQQGDQRFINGLTDNGTGSVKNLVQMFEGIGGLESGICLTPRKEYDFASQVRNLDDYTDVESPSKRLRLTRHEPIQNPPPSTPARASPARGPRAGRGRRRPSKQTSSSPSCRDRSGHLQSRMCQGGRNARLGH